MQSTCFASESLSHLCQPALRSSGESIAACDKMPLSLLLRKSAMTPQRSRAIYDSRERGNAASIPNWGRCTSFLIESLDIFVRSPQKCRETANLYR